MSDTNDTPYQWCERCGRCTWTVGEFNQKCWTRRSDGSLCCGRFGPETLLGDALAIFRTPEAVA